MIFLDANMFLRYIVAPTPDDPNGPTVQEIATNLFDSLAAGTEEATTTEVVLHEVCYVLASPRQYRLSPSEIAKRLAPIIALPGLKLPRGEKGLYRRAFEIYVSYPKLEFADSLIAARAERLKIPLATCDEALGRLPFITHWAPPTAG